MCASDDADQAELDEVRRRAMAVPGVVSVTGLFAVPFREMFGLWRLSRSMRAAHRAEDEEFAQL